ncbi:prostacyclin receptor [Ictalurus punctatus]|uniref:Thromboxane A2 receptor n=1 Tax=Ictalurus punctatus TaxID=7998 RepID=W5U7N1_ICTPU|nr:prostacyclin receptor [Ictalurus punctatus]
MMIPNSACENVTHIEVQKNPANLVVSAIMFLAGVVGNLLALAILGVHQKERRTKSNVFCILVTGLAVTDLAGTCLLSPPVFVCYAHATSLVGLTGDMHLCGSFAFALTFFGLASMLILCAMAVERCLAISHPYFYSKHVRRHFAKVALILIYLFTGAFCLLPIFGIGRYKQYCPGTWCFIKMEAGNEDKEEGRRTLAFSLSYSLLMALLIAVVFVCNGSVIVSLCRMHRSQITRRGSVVSTGRKKRLSTWFGQGEEEMDHLVLLASMTIIFVICSLPLTIFGFVNAISQGSGNDERNLLAFRFSALNPVVDPWVFIIFRKSIFQHVRALLYCRFSKAAVKNTAQDGLSHRLESMVPAESSALQSKIFSDIPQ